MAPLSLHKYSFTHNDPINLVDPSGHFASMSEASAAINIIGIIAISSAVLPSVSSTSKCNTQRSEVAQVR
jgi:hypothetical protein